MIIKKGVVTKMFKRWMIMFVVLICSSLIFFVGLGEDSEAAMEFSRDIFIENLDENVFLVIHQFPWPANSLIVKMADGTIVLVDTPYTPAATRDLLGWIEEQFGQSQLVAINTHFHLDNLGGNEALVEAGIPVYGSDLTVQLIGERGEEARALMMSWLPSPDDERFRNAFASISYIPPTEIFPLAEGKVLKFGEETVEIYYPGETHAPDNVVVYFPERKLLFGSCMVKSLEDLKLGNIADANLGEWPTSVKKVMDRYQDAEIVIPGHGSWGGQELLSHTLELLKIYQ
jgi:glyoxylase-like metal-dependent hydrolase (beta-lactamase superfamily II)